MVSVHLDQGATNLHSAIGASGHLCVTSNVSVWWLCFFHLVALAIGTTHIAISTPGVQIVLSIPGTEGLIPSLSWVYEYDHQATITERDTCWKESEFTIVTDIITDILTQAASAYSRDGANHRLTKIMHNLTSATLHRKRVELCLCFFIDMMTMAGHLFVMRDSDFDSASSSQQEFSKN